MSLIHILDDATINQIAAGEVVERPSAVVKELIENAMDAGATAITAEIKEGGLTFIRITDNGSGISKEDIPFAFLRHATSKIRTAADLLSVTSLGFRGEALSSIASVAQVELITKTPKDLNGFRYIIEGGEEKSLEEIGCPGGTTILVRNLFYNTPARRKFLKSATTEAGYISDLMERLMVSHPNISFKFIMNNSVKLQSSGNNSSKDILYQVYGREITKELLPLDFHHESLTITGFIGKPVINRGNRNYENYFINGRYIKSNVITKAIEEAYKPFLMQHKYPFTSMYFEIDPGMIDVNVHPQKLEIRFKNGEELYQLIYQAIQATLSGKELIPKVLLTKQEEAKEPSINLPEPFEQNRRSQLLGEANKQTDRKLSGSDVNAHNNLYQKSGTYASPDQAHTNRVEEQQNPYRPNLQVQAKNSPAASLEALKILSTVTDAPTENPSVEKNNKADQNYSALKVPTVEGATQEASDLQTSINLQVSTDLQASKDLQASTDLQASMDLQTSMDLQASMDLQVSTNLKTSTVANGITNVTPDNQQLKLFSDQASEEEAAPFLSKRALEEHRILGQLFSTYWLVEYHKELYIIDQHAAHEKVLYERIIAALKNKTYTSQQLLPPIVLTLSLREQEVLKKREQELQSIGYEIEHFGGNEFSIRAVPADLYSISEKELLLEFIDELAEELPASVNTGSILERVASLSCKAAVKANHTFSYEEASALIKELLTLENPYHCPHGRPVIVSMSQSELERKFKRIL